VCDADLHGVMMAKVPHSLYAFRWVTLLFSQVLSPSHPNPTQIPLHWSPRDTTKNRGESIQQQLQWGKNLVAGSKILKFWTVGIVNGHFAIFVHAPRSAEDFYLFVDLCIALIFFAFFCAGKILDENTVQIPPPRILNPG